MKQRRPRWRPEEAPLLAASAPAQTRSRHPFFKVPYGGKGGGVGRGAQKLLKMIYSVRGCTQRPAGPGEEQRCVLLAGLLSSGSFAALISQR